MSHKFLTVSNQTQVLKLLPRQYALSEKGAIESAEKAGETATSATSLLAGSSFAVNLLMVGSMSLLWGLVNSLQLLIFNVFINIRFPA